MFSFLTAGGQFEVEFDWFQQTNTDDRPGAADIYDASPRVLALPIIRAPEYRIDVALDHKPHLLEQAALLDLYERTVEHDAQTSLPFSEGAFATVFSNILYWCDEPLRVLHECARVLTDGGRAIVCVPDPMFHAWCESYHWRTRHSAWLQHLNGGRDACLRWTACRADFEQWASKAGFEVVSHRSYLHQRTVVFWDTSLRPVSRPLCKLVNGLSREARASFKQEWIAAVRPLLDALLDEELRASDPGGFHLFTLRKIG